MDLSIRPWLVKLILLGGLIARPMEAQADPALAADSANQRVWRLQRAREDAVDHWSALEQRDSAINLLRRTVDPLVVSFSGFSPATDWKTMESAIRRSVGSPASIQPNVRLGVLVYNGRRYSPDKPTQGWRGYTGTHLAQEGPALLCVTLISAGEEQIAAEHRSVYSGGDWEHYLAPCLWYARFGRPGPKISAWLASTRFSAGLDLRGLGTEPDTARRASEIPWRTSYWFGDWGQLGFFGRLNIVASTLYGLHRPPRYGVGRHALLCAQGSKVDCAFSVLDTASQSRMGKAWPDGFIHEAAYETADEMRGIAANHPVRQSFLGDLLISKGPERFRRFWKSDAPFEHAFRESFGMELGDYTYRWARALWDRSDEDELGTKEFELGPHVRLTDAALVLGWSLLAFAAVASVARRREIII